MEKLLKNLICAQTTAEKGELKAAEIILAEFNRSNAIDCRIDNWQGNRANVVAKVKSSGRRPGLLFACHIDVVGPGEAAWKYPPFSATEVNGKIYGRGSSDMKGGTAAIVTAIREIVDSSVKLNGDIIFLAAAGEETDSCEAKRFVQNCGDIGSLAGIVIPEPTNFDIVTNHRGLFWVEFGTIGKCAHGSAPQLGINAISLMKDLLDELEIYKHKHLTTGCSVSINTIAGGKAINVVPDECTVGVDIRTTVEQTHAGLIGDFETILKKLKKQKPPFEGKIKVVRDVAALNTDNNCHFVKEFCSCVGINETKTVGFCTDGPVFEPLKSPVVIFGPGNPEFCHRADEYIEIADVKKAVEYYKNIILKFLT
jgi:succinyl-diaminopimelate desuccinylase